MSDIGRCREWGWRARPVGEMIASMLAEYEGLTQAKVWLSKVLLRAPSYPSICHQFACGDALRQN